MGLKYQVFTILVLTSLIAYVLYKNMKLKIIDIVDELPTNSTVSGRTRAIKEIDGIVIHHTHTDTNMPILKIANYHVNTKNWHRIGYHFIVKNDGTIYKVNNVSKASAHAGYEANTHTIGIALLNDFTKNNISKEASASLKKLVKYLSKKYDLKTLAGHRYYRPTSCPIIDVSEYAKAGDLIDLEKTA